MPEISKINLFGIEYDIKDATARGANTLMGMRSVNVSEPKSYPEDGFEIEDEKPSER